jgi:hypothetical protein
MLESQPWASSHHVLVTITNDFASNTELNLCVYHPDLWEGPRVFSNMDRSTSILPVLTTPLP